MSEETELLREIRDLLLVVAEPEIAKRDEKCRVALRRIVGRSQHKAKAALLMDGSRSQIVIVKEAGIDRGLLSRFVKELREARLIGPDDKALKLVIRVPETFFDGAEEE